MVLGLRSVVVVVVGRGRVVVVVCWGFEQATMHASYLARAAAMHAGSRFTHCPPSEIHWFWQPLAHLGLPPFEWLPDVEAATPKLASVIAAMTIALAGSIRSGSHLAVAFIMLVGFVAMGVDAVSKSGALERAVNASKTRDAAAGDAAPLQRDAIPRARPARSCGESRRSVP